jgi:hypothetical protein
VTTRGPIVHDWIPGHVPLLRGPRRPRTGVVRALYLTGLRRFT